MAESPKVSQIRSNNSNPLQLRGTGLFQWMKRIIAGANGSFAERNVYNAFGYKLTPTLDDYLMAYRRNGVANRVINAPVRATWSDPPIIDADAGFLQRWQDLGSAQALWRRIMQLDRLASLGQYAIMVIGTDDGQDLDKPVNGLRNGVQRNCIYLQPFLQKTARISLFDTNTASPRFGKPVMYQITPQGNDLENTFIGNKGGAPSTVQGGGNSPSQIFAQPFYCHWSRVLHIAPSAMENDVYGVPELESIFNWLDDLTKVIGGSAETYWMIANRGITANVDKDLDLDPEDAADLSAELDEFQNNLRRIIRTRGVDVKSLGSDVADPLNNVDVLISMIAGSKGIPKRVLLGSEAGQLASTQDRANWAERTMERQQEYGQPVVLLPFIRQLVAMSILPEPQTLTVNWPDAFKLSPLERGQTSAQMARSTANLMKSLSNPILGVEITETTVEQEMEDVPAQDAVPPDPNVPGDTGKPAVPATKQPTGNVKTVVKKYVQGGTQMFTVEEARNIVGFGKTMPVFDDKKDSHAPAATGDN